MTDRVTEWGMKGGEETGGQRGAKEQRADTLDH